MPFGKDVPQIAITQEPEDDDDDENYEGAPIAESVTDTEDLEEGTSVRSTRSSTLKIKLNSDDCTTDVEDLEASDENPEDDDTDGEVELEGDAIEEEDVENDVRVINAKGEKKTQQSTRQHTGTASKAFKIFEGYTDEELFETDNEMEPEETPDNHFNMNYDTGVTDVTESSNLEKKSSKTKGSNKNYLSTISLTPNLSDLTDVEIINSDDESDSPKKTKTKRRRRRSFYGKSVTDVEDLEMSDDESKPKPHAKKTQSKHTKVKYTSLNFDSDNEENFSFPITKRVAKKEAILNVPEFNTNFLTDTEDFVSLIGSDTGYPDKDSSSDTEFVKKMDELAECYSQTRSSQKVYATDLDDTDVICLSENRPPLVEATDDSKCPTDVEEFDEDGDESASYPDIELPPPVNNMMIFSEKGTFPTVRIVPIPYKDEDSQESSEVAGISTGEESVSDFEEESAADDSVSLPNTDWGVVSIRDESVDKKNLPPDTDVSIQKRRKPPKFKHIYESELNHKNRLRAAMNGEADSKTDTEELFIDKARSGKTETSTDEDCSSQSRTCTPALLREQNESEVEPASVDVMYLKGGGYFPEILDAKSQSFTVLLQHYKEYCRLGDICNCVKEVGSPKEELSTNNKAGVAEEKDGSSSNSSTKNEACYLHHSPIIPFPNSKTFETQLEMPISTKSKTIQSLDTLMLDTPCLSSDSVLDETSINQDVLEIHKDTSDEIPLHVKESLMSGKPCGTAARLHPNLVETHTGTISIKGRCTDSPVANRPVFPTSNKPCVSTLELHPNIDVLIEVPIKKSVLRRKKYRSSREICINKKPEDTADETKRIGSTDSIDIPYAEQTKYKVDLENIPANSKTSNDEPQHTKQEDVWYEGTLRDTEAPLVDLNVNSNFVSFPDVSTPVCHATSSSLSQSVTGQGPSRYNRSSSSSSADSLPISPPKNVRADVKVLVKTSESSNLVAVRSVRDFLDEAGEDRQVPKSRRPKKRTFTLPARTSGQSCCLSDKKRSLSTPFIPLALRTSSMQQLSQDEATFVLPTLFCESSKGKMKLVPVPSTSFPLKYDNNESFSTDNPEHSSALESYSARPFDSPDFSPGPFPNAYCDWLIQSSGISKEARYEDALTDASVPLNLLAKQPQPKPRPSKTPESLEKDESDKPKSPVRDDLLDQEDAPESYLDKKKFWESVTQEQAQKRLVAQETHEKDISARKRVSISDFSSIPVPKPRTVLCTSQSLVDSTETVVSTLESSTSEINKQKPEEQFQLSKESKPKLSELKKKPSVDSDAAFRGSGQISDNLGYISDSEDVEHYISDSEIEDRVPQIRDRMMSVFVPTASSAACKARYERSASLPTEDLYEVSARAIKARKDYYEEQIRKEMIEEQLTSEIEEEPSPEKKNLLDSTEEDRTEADARSIGEDVEDIREEHAKMSKASTVSEKIGRLESFEESRIPASPNDLKHYTEEDLRPELDKSVPSRESKQDNNLSNVRQQTQEFIDLERSKIDHTKELRLASEAAVFKKVTKISNQEQTKIGKETVVSKNEDTPSEKPQVKDTQVTGLKYDHLLTDIKSQTEEFISIERSRIEQMDKLLESKSDQSLNKGVKDTKVIDTKRDQLLADIKSQTEEFISIERSIIEQTEKQLRDKTLISAKKPPSVPEVPAPSKVARNSKMYTAPKKEQDSVPSAEAVKKHQKPSDKKGTVDSSKGVKDSIKTERTKCEGVVPDKKIVVDKKVVSPQGKDKTPTPIKNGKKVPEKVMLVKTELPHLEQTLKQIQNQTNEFISAERFRADQEMTRNVKEADLERQTMADFIDETNKFFRAQFDEETSIAEKPRAGLLEGTKNIEETRDKTKVVTEAQVIKSDTVKEKVVIRESPKQTLNETKNQIEKFINEERIEADKRMIADKTQTALPIGKTDTVVVESKDKVKVTTPSKDSSRDVRDETKKLVSKEPVKIGDKTAIIDNKQKGDLVAVVVPVAVTKEDIERFINTEKAKTKNQIEKFINEERIEADKRMIADKTQTALPIGKTDQVVVESKDKVKVTTPIKDSSKDVRDETKKLVSKEPVKIGDKTAIIDTKKKGDLEAVVVPVAVTKEDIERLINTEKAETKNQIEKFINEERIEADKRMIADKTQTALPIGKTDQVVVESKDKVKVTTPIKDSSKDVRDETKKLVSKKPVKIGDKTAIIDNKQKGDLEAVVVPAAVTKEDIERFINTEKAISSIHDSPKDSKSSGHAQFFTNNQIAEVNGGYYERRFESQQSISSDKSGDLVDEQNFKDDSLSTKPDSMEVLVDKSEIEDSEKLTDLDQDIESNNFDETEYNNDIEVTEPDIRSSIKVPQEHVQDVLWEVPVQSQARTAFSEQVEELHLPKTRTVKTDFQKMGEWADRAAGEKTDKDVKGADAGDSSQSDKLKKDDSKEERPGQSDIERLIFDCLQQQKVHPDEAQKIANALVEEIEAEISKHETLGSESSENVSQFGEKANIPEFLRHLADTKGLDEREIELVESVLARRKKGLGKLTREDTQASSVEITDEDLKYSGTEVDYSQILEQQIDQLEAEKINNVKLDSVMFEEPASDSSKNQTQCADKTSEAHSEESQWSHDYEINEDAAVTMVKTGGLMKTSDAVKSEKLERTFVDVDKKVTEKTNKDVEVVKTHIKGDLSESTDVVKGEVAVQVKRSGQVEGNVDHAKQMTHGEIAISSKDKDTVKGEQHLVELDKVVVDSKSEVEAKYATKDLFGTNKTTTKDKLDEMNKFEEKLLKEKSTKVEEGADGSQTIIKTEIDEAHSEEHSTTSDVHQEETVTSTISTSTHPDKSKTDTEIVIEKTKTIVEHQVVARRTSNEHKEDIEITKTVPSVILRKSKSDSSGSSAHKAERKSGYDFEINSSSGESHYQSFELDSNKSRPCSSDIEGFVPAGSSEYESALTSQVYSARSQISSTEYQTPASSMSSKESMKSLDSESSGNLASVEVSEHSETLVPSTSDLEDLMDQQILTDDNEQNVIWNNQNLLNEVSDSEGFSYTGVDESMEVSEEEPAEMRGAETHSKMKRSCEMTFQPIPKVLASSESPQGEADEKLGTSFDDGSVFTSSTSSLGTQRTVIEQRSRADSDKLEGSMTVSGTSEHLSLEDVESIPRGSVESIVFAPSGTTTDMATSTDTQSGILVGSVTLTTSSVDVNGIQSVSTQVTSEEHIAEEKAPAQATAEPKKKGHKRTDSVLMGSVMAEPKLVTQQDSKEEIAEGQKEATSIGSITSQFIEKERGDRRSKLHDVPSEKSSMEEGEADAVFGMVASVSPVHKIKQICPILEDDVAEKKELETQESLKRKQQRRMAEIQGDRSPGFVPDIMITQHMTPLVDDNFRYPDLELEAKEKEESLIGADTPQTPASSSSKSSEETDQGRDYVVNETIRSTILEEPEGVCEEIGRKETESPDSNESFEMLDKPDLIDDFVVIEEVGKEADELDAEGKSVKICKVQKHRRKPDEGEEEPLLVHSAPTPLTRITDIKYFPEADFEESPPDKNSNNAASTRDYIDKELEANRKWVEQQFQGDHASIMAAGYGYEMEFERGPLEDIKEEDVTDFAASSYGSQKDSGGSVKESYSSTPEYDVLAGRKYFTRSGEHDDASMSSLQEFENLEQAMSLEMRKFHQGSQDSSSNGSFKTRYVVSKSGQGDDISVSSLKEFEGLEKACIAAHKIEVKVKEEEALLAQIEEGQESAASESESCETLSGTAKKVETDEEEDYEKRMFEIDEIIKQAQSNVERFIDPKDVEQTESLGRGDSVEEVSKVPELDLDAPIKSTVKVQWKENDDVMITSTDSLEAQPVKPAHHDSTDSLEQQETTGNLMTSSTDSLEAQIKKSSKYSKDSVEATVEKNYIVSSDSLDIGAIAHHSSSIDEDSSRFGVYDHSTSSTGKDLNSSTKDDDLSQDKDQPGVADLLDISSSTATHATYQFETDSVFSGSFTSGGSNTMVSSTNSIDQTKQAIDVDLAAAVRKVWFEEDIGDDSSKPYVTEIIEPSEEERYSHVIHRKVELPPEVRKITFTGADADERLRQYIQDFDEGEESYETEEVDKDGNVHIKRVVKRRFIVKEEGAGAQMSSSEIEDYFKQLNQGKEVIEGKGIGTDVGTSSKTVTNVSRGTVEVSTTKAMDQAPPPPIKATRRRPLRYEISVEDQTEVDPREHDWRFNLPKHAEGEEAADPGTSETKSEEKQHPF